MLVLSRKVGQSLIIGDNIEVIVNKINGDRVSLAIKAPDDVHIRRNELVDRTLEIKDEGTEECLPKNNN